MSQSQSVPASSALVPIAAQDDGNNLISQWLGGSAVNAGFIKTSLDLSTRRGLEAATRMSGESEYDNSKIDGKSFTLTGYAIKAVHDTDPETGELTIYPRVTLSCDDGTHLAFSGRVMLESVLLLACGIKPDEWASGVKV